MSSEPYVPDEDVIENAYVDAHLDGRRGGIPAQVSSAEFRRGIAKIKAKAWATGLDTGIGYKLGLDLMGPDAPEPINPFEQGAREE